MKNDPEKPITHTDVYGRNAPDAAKFGVGATTRAEIEKATNARRDLRPGDDYYAK